VFLLVLAHPGSPG